MRKKAEKSYFIGVYFTWQGRIAQIRVKDTQIK